MPVHNVAPTRPKLYHRATKLSRDRREEVTSEHGHAVEYVVRAVGLCVNIIFVGASITFLEGFPAWVGAVGDWLFIIASVVTVIQATLSAHEAWVSWGHPDFQDERSLLSQACRQERLKDEFAENLHYVAASIVFLAGCLFFMPGLYSDELSEEYGHEAGAWCFIVGSFGFVLASYWNACGLATEFGQSYEPGTRESRCMRLASISLCLAMLGGVFFVSGSWMYRPGYSKDCAKDTDPTMSLLGRMMVRHHHTRHRSYNLRHAAALAADRSMAAAAMAASAGEGDLCLDAYQSGTWMFIIGSCLFLAQSVISTVCTVIMSAAKDGKSAASSGKSR